jgi:DNA-binding Lrp family transcriptional regulator
MSAQKKGLDTVGVETPKASSVGTEQQPSKPKAKPEQAYVSWREWLPIHPAADKYPLLDQRDLIDLGDDIKRNGLAHRPIIGQVDGVWMLCDGRNRLDAMEAVGIYILDSRLPPDRSPTFVKLPLDTDVDAYIASANLFRRHLTMDQRAEKIAALIEAHAEKSNLQISKMAGVSHPTIAKARAKMEESGTLKPVSTRTDTKGREQPATKPREVKEKLKTTDPKPPTPPPDNDQDEGDGLALREMVCQERTREATDLVVTALRDFARYTLLNIASGHLKLSGDPERYRKWRDLKARVEPLINGRSP